MLSLNIIYFHYQVNIIAQKGKKSDKDITAWQKANIFLLIVINIKRNEIKLHKVSECRTHLTVLEVLWVLLQTGKNMEKWSLVLIWLHTYVKDWCEYHSII